MLRIYKYQENIFDHPYFIWKFVDLSTPKPTITYSFGSETEYYTTPTLDPIYFIYLVRNIYRTTVEPAITFCSFLIRPATIKDDVKKFQLFNAKTGELFLDLPPSTKAGTYGFFNTLPHTSLYKKALPKEKRLTKFIRFLLVEDHDDLLIELGYFTTNPPYNNSDLIGYVTPDGVVQDKDKKPLNCESCNCFNDKIVKGICPRLKK